MIRPTCHAAAVLACLVTLSCADAITEAAPDAPAAADDKAHTSADKADQWADADDPAIFSADLDYRVDALPLQGEVSTIPWASSCWPVHQDSINHRWDGADSLSPAAKYGQAFGGDDVEAQVSRFHGIDRYASRARCSSDADCEGELSEACARRSGQEQGRCVPTWWGICHAWASASVMEAEPRHPVTRKGVTFKVNDIKALISLVYNRPRSRFVSLRCNQDAGADEVAYDVHGRPTGDDAECHDTNPGTYHVLLANYIGLRGQSFIEDRTWDLQTSNQPLRGYRITRQERVSTQQANALLGVRSESEGVAESHQVSGTVADGAWHHLDAFSVPAGATLVVDMTGSADADVYVRFGALATLDSYDCRSWQAGSEERCEVSAPEDGAARVFVSIHGYSGPADFDVRVAIGDPGDAPTEYPFSDAAAALYHVELEVDYVAESSPESDGNLADVIDRYTHTDHYQYILEVDAQGRINGGEWIGESKRAHPDFLWLPQGRYHDTVAGGAIEYGLVKQLLDASIAPVAAGGGEAEVVEADERGTLAQGEWRHFGPYQGIGDDFVASVTGTGDVDLYLRAGEAPDADNWDCRPYDNGGDERCTADGPGPIYVSVHAYRASEFTLTVRFTPAAGAAVDAEPPALGHLSEAGELGQGAMAYYTVDVLAGRPIVVRTSAPSDIDLYAKMNMAPTTLVYDRRAYTASGDETLTLVPSADGTLHIGVHGYQASSYSLSTADL